MLYLWLKVGHIVAFTAWFAGIFYIWRLFVYHAESESTEVQATLEVMQRKLMVVIMRPAGLLTFIFGMSMFVLNWAALSGQLWIWLKLVLVSLVFVNHGMAEYYRGRLNQGVRYPGKRFRLLNEVPTLLLVLIVILAVLKNAIV